jgi:acetolactate synthase I/II/III large subunit
MSEQGSGTLRCGGQVLVDQLLIHGSTLGFCVPGESYLAVLDALHDVRDRFRLINARHEAGAAHMAEAHGKLTGRPGLCFVTRGPGATHAAVGVHTAMQDSTPMILLVGQVATTALHREAFQEIDYRAMFGGVAKWVGQIESAARIPEYVSRAYHIATSGRPGPVVLALPEDVLTELVEVADAAPYRPVVAEVSAAAVEELGLLLDAAERPLFLVGGSGWTDAACASFTRFAERVGVPVACSFRRQDVVDNASEIFCGDLGTSGPTTLPGRVREADLVIVVGSRLSEMTTQAYSIMEVPRPAQRLVHVHADPDEIGRVYAPDLALVGSVASFVEAASQLPAGPASRWASWRATLRGEYERAAAPAEYPSPLNLSTVIGQMQGLLPDDAVLTLDAGNHTGWAQRFFRFGRPGRQLGPTSGAMGYSVPAAVSAAIATSRVVVGCVGDGGFMMSGLELATAVQYGARPIILVFNNGMYGTIRMHQEREYPGRVIGTDLPSVDFVALATSLGAHAERVMTTAAFAPALHRALSAERAALIELVCDPGQLTTRSRMSAPA